MTSFANGEKAVGLLNSLSNAIDIAKNAIQFFTVGIPMIKRGPKGELHVDIPVMYLNFAIDRVHYDPQLNMVSPKGKTVRAMSDVDIQEIKKIIEETLKEAYIVEAAEFREPENAWVIPIAWNKLIIMHVKVSYDGEIIPDYRLTQEVRKHVN